MQDLVYEEKVILSHEETVVPGNNESGKMTKNINRIIDERARCSIGSKPKYVSIYMFIAELQRAKRASGAPWVRIFGKPMRPRKFGCVLPPARPPTHPRLQTRGEGEGSLNAIRSGRGRKEMSAISTIPKNVNKGYNFDIHVMVN